MKSLSVGDCLVEADRQIRDITVDVDGLDVDRLLVGWRVLRPVVQRALTSLELPWAADRPPAVLALGVELSRPLPRLPAGIDPDPRLTAAAELIQRATDLVEQYATPAAPDRDQVTGHIAAMTCIAAHAVRRGISEYLADTEGSISRPGRQGPSAGDSVYSSIPRHTISGHLSTLARVEDLAAVTLVEGARHPPPAVDAPGGDRLRTALDAWATRATAVLASDTATPDDLRQVAQLHVVLAKHTIVLVDAAAARGLWRPADADLTRSALARAGRAWAEAAGEWPRSMAVQSRQPDRELRAAAVGARQTLSGITHPYPSRWATSAEIAQTHDLGQLLEHLTATHRLVDHMGQSYAPSAARLFGQGLVTVPGHESFEFTGRVHGTGRVLVPRGYAARCSYAATDFAASVHAARDALDNATVMTPEAIRARARLPLSMSAADIDQAIRERVAQASAGERLDQVAEDLEAAARTTGSARARDRGPVRDRQGPRLQ